MARAGYINIPNAIAEGMLNDNILNGVTSVTASLLDATTTIDETTSLWSAVSSHEITTTGTHTLPVTRTTSNPYLFGITTTATFSSTTAIQPKYICYHTNTNILGFALLDSSGNALNVDPNTEIKVAPMNGTLIKLTIS